MDSKPNTPEEIAEQNVRDIQKEIDQEMIGVQKATDQFRGGVISLEKFLKEMDLRERRMGEILNKLQGLIAASTQGVS